ncbi:hypothetical protein P7K49_036812 [Saguinus oedipus]|uniref:BTB domain-containing protein n=1 Tax=Saguinus oedipus TaxID=9490 RepID=A0ABQ9TL75_SAGOE|nr:hypothetical protein P7K49_036812 [Saguinus oedipus]
MAEGSAVSDPQHAARLLRALSSFREESRFCDAHLVLDGEEIPVQKNILAAASPYIRWGRGRGGLVRRCCPEPGAGRPGRAWPLDPIAYPRHRGPRVTVWRGVPPGKRRSRAPLAASPGGPCGFRARAPHRTPAPLAVVPGPGSRFPASSSPGPTAAAGARPRRPRGPQTPCCAGWDPHPRAGRGRVREEPPLRPFRARGPRWSSPAACLRIHAPGLGRRRQPSPERPARGEAGQTAPRGVRAEKTLSVVLLGMGSRTSRAKFFSLSKVTFPLVSGNCLRVTR